MDIQKTKLCHSHIDANIQCAAVCGSGGVRKCGNVATCTAVRQCAAAVRTVMCGSARSSVCLFAFTNCIRLNLR
jgi:hypothetical protein